MSKFKPIHRRTFLKGAGAMIALPWLEAMIPQRAYAQTATPLRVLSCYFPFGVYDQAFAPSTYGTNFTVPTTLSSIANYKNRVILTRGLGLYKVPSGMAHYNALSTFSTGLRIDSGCDGAQLRVGTASASYKIQQFLKTQNPALKQMYIGNAQCLINGSYCDGVGYAPITQRYADKMEWANSTTPLSMTLGPQAVFDALFSGTQPNNPADPLVAFRKARGIGVLDTTLEEQTRLMSKLGASDRQKLDQYFTGIREVEKILQASSSSTPVMTCTPGSRPAGGLRFDAEIKVFMDLIALAFACDKSRVISYTLDNEESGQRTLDFLGMNESYHMISHWRDGGDRIQHFKNGNKFYADQLGYLLQKLTSYKEGDNDLLYNSFIVYGSGHTDGGHDTYNLPIVLAGELGGSVKTGQALNLPNTSMQNVYLTVMKKLGMPDTSHGDSNGTLPI